ncbi:MULTISPECIES: ROK family protein [unclassified Oceanobacillus]|uniref:ROK family protein n=1 Tax=unclassified Oceanobacillus TaxID=2630292 RepID=UPI0012EB8BB8|nr:ROK family protein [Oceanobacillus sp. AG]
MSYSLGVDIGGTKVAAVIIDQSGVIHNRHEVLSEPHDQELMFSRVLACINQVVSKSTITFDKIIGMGVGIPGKVDRKKGVAIYQSNINWRNFPIVDRLKEEIPLENIVIDNDVRVATFAEYRAHHSAREDTFVYVTISTGIACSIIDNGKFVRGNGFSGEIGLLPIRSTASKKEWVTIEETASGPAIQKLISNHYGQPNLAINTFFEKYYKQDSSSEVLLQEVIQALAQGLYSIICLLDPQYIVLGGGVVINNPVLLDLVKEELKNYLIPEQLESLNFITLSNYKGDSGAIGAGLLALSSKNK